nr:O-antigen ligase family protein [Bacteroides faecis]
MISAKRTAFLCVGLVFLFLFLSNMLSITIKSLFRFMGITIVLFGVGYYSYTNYPDFATQADLIIGRFEDPEDNESNRERIDMYQRAYTAFLSSTLLEQLFGHGYKAIERDLYGRPTHNDLLEILYDYGLISLIVYLLFLINLLAHGINMFRANKQNIYLLFTIFNLLLLSMMNCMITNPVFVFVNNFCIGFSLNYFQESKSSSL